MNKPGISFESVRTELMQEKNRICLRLNWLKELGHRNLISPDWKAEIIIRV